MECKCKHPLSKQLLKSNKKCDFHTGIQTLKQFAKVYDEFHQLEQLENLELYLKHLGQDVNFAVKMSRY